MEQIRSFSSHLTASSLEMPEALITTSLICSIKLELSNWCCFRVYNIQLRWKHCNTFVFLNTHYKTTIFSVTCWCDLFCITVWRNGCQFASITTLFYVFFHFGLETRCHFWPGESLKQGKSGFNCIHLKSALIGPFVQMTRVSIIRNSCGNKFVW